LVGRKNRAMRVRFPLAAKSLLDYLPDHRINHPNELQRNVSRDGERVQR
jgi:hypothetical protein